MTHAPRCRLCGDRKQLGRDGCCTWRAGCEHRQLREVARRREVEYQVAISVEESFFDVALDQDEADRYHELGRCRSAPQPPRPDLER